MSDARRKTFRVGLAVSGGADSVALLVLMASLRASHGFEPVVLHFDHGIRKESADDAAFVKRLAARLGLPFHAARVKVTRRKGESIEMAARRERLKFFAASMKRLHLDCIATGHQMDDVAETFLMRLKRSSGAAGLAGLKPVSFVEDIVFIRPLLNVRGKDLRDYLRARGIAWREDATNADTSILRNKVRHVILPFLARELDPQIVEHICRSVGYLRELAEDEARGVAHRRTLEMRPPMDGTSVVPGTACTTDGGALVGRRAFVLSVEAAQGYEKTVVEIGSLPADSWMDAAALKGRTLEVRAWRAGDWMRPSGFPHRRKLQDIFVTAKTPPAIRHSLPVIADAETGEVLWIPGYRVSESVKVPSPSSPSVHFSLKHDNQKK